MTKYNEWIVANGFDGELAVLGRCEETTVAMVTAFPELKRVRGHYICPWWGRRAHWWCVTPEGAIVDPTAAQFPSYNAAFQSKGAGEYVPWTEGAPEPTGKCLDCGEEVFGGANFCNEECERSTMEDMGFTRKVDGAWRR